MFKSDKIFDVIRNHLPTQSRREAMVSFRRAHRTYIVHKGGKSKTYGVKASRSIIISAKIVFTGGRRRKIVKYLKPKHQRQGPGRPPNLPEEYLVSRLAFIWWKATKKRTSISYKRWGGAPTKYELFMKDVMAELGIFNYRKYLELHSQKRRSYLSATIF